MKIAKKLTRTQIRILENYLWLADGTGKFQRTLKKTAEYLGTSTRTVKTANALFYRMGFLKPLKLGIGNKHSGQGTLFNIQTFMATTALNEAKAEFQKGK